MRSLDVCTGSPKHRSSIVAAPSLSVDTGLESECDISAASSHTVIQHQPSLDQTTTLKAAMTTVLEQTEMVSISAEPLEKILEHKLVKEKRLEMEKKMETMRKKHDKEKLRVSAQKSGDLTDGIRRSKFYMNNKLVKRLSSKNIDVNVPIPPCPSDLSEASDGDCSDRPSVTRSQSERLIIVCREFSSAYQEIQEKYHEIIYSTAE
ncbi:1-phosphatidylinositol 4,5-bisphosphate phosphodiesterase classes I and II, partial [Pseudolycoriella hygida]